MDSRKRKPILNSHPSSPLPNLPSSSSIFRDISNFKTPRHPSKPPNFEASPQFFTARKNTPSASSLRRGFKSSALKSKAARRLKAFEIEQSKSARKAQTEKEKSLKSLARSLTVWLNFLFENPSSCGCDPASFTGELNGSDSILKEVIGNNGKRESGPSRTVGVDGPWRGPKRQRDSFWRGVEHDELGKSGFSNSMFSGLRTSLQDICSFEDLKERMRMYLSLDSCKDIFDAMTQVSKNIDEGRLKMRASCPIVSDVGMKEKAMRVLMSYNPIWLRIGLYIIFGGDSLLPNGDINSEHENAFLRMVLEKQFFPHTGLAKAHAYNKQVEGLYRPGYYEKLGNVILKRFLLLAVILDRAKCQTSLPLKYGIDGLDGGSPPLFSSIANVKSSRQLITDFLTSDSMHGEGNLLAHLVIVGYKVTYQQNPLVEYDFKVTDLLEDLRDGVRLCRAIGLLKHDPSILMKVVVPSDTQKKRLVNCGIALQYLRQAGVPLLDEDGTEIIGEDVVNGDKELTLSLLWNMFVHLQLPLLINKKLLTNEISNIQGVMMEDSSAQMPLDLLLKWVQAVCETYDFKVESHFSLLDGKAMWCLLDYYFRKEHDCSCSSKEHPDGTNRGVSIMSVIEYTDAVHNFILSQKLTSLLGNFPEVLQVSDIIEDNGACNGQSVIVLLVFLSVQLLVKRNMDKLNFHKLLGFGCQNPNNSHLSTEGNHEDSTKKFKAIIAWWQEMAHHNGKCNLEPNTFFAQSSLTGRKGSAVQRENAAIIIQSHYRRLVELRIYKRIRNATLVLQSFTLAWLSAKKKVSSTSRSKLGSSTSTGKPFEKFGMYVTFMADRHYFINLRNSTIVIQQAIRAWISRRYKAKTIGDQRLSQEPINVAIIHSCSHEPKEIYAYTQAQRDTPLQEVSVAYEENRADDLQTTAATVIQNSWKNIYPQSIQNENMAATKIQSYYRGWLMRKSFACKKQAIRMVQRSFRCLKSRRDFQILKKENVSAIIIQSHIRGWMARGEAHRYGLQTTSAIVIQNSWKNYISRKSIRKQHIAATQIQSHYRGWLMRKSYACKKRAIKLIQGSFRSSRIRRDFQILKKQNVSVIIIQSHIRGWMARREAHREKNHIIRIQSFCRGWMQRKEFLLQKDAATIIQSAFRCMNCLKAFLLQRDAAVDIQCFVRGHITRRRFLGAFCSQKSLKYGYQGLELKIFLQSVVKLQRWWRQVLQFRLKRKSAVLIQSHFRGWIAKKKARKEMLCAVVIQSCWKGYLARKDARHQLLDLQLRTKSAVVIQSYFRGWIARQIAKREKQRVVLIQSQWRGYLARKHAKGQLQELRLRMQKSAANVDDSRRLINRLISALSELLSMKSISNILHTCATLDVATELSQKCCEELVGAGAICTLLKLIRSVSRSIPDQQVLKHALSTLRNLARYPDLTEVLIQSHGCVETVVLEFIRNKEEGYFVAAELLKRICKSKKGAGTIRKSPALLKRLNNLAEELSRKAGNDKRNTRNLGAKEIVERRRFKEAVEILRLVANA